jgi:hypothetical protein
MSRAQLHPPSAPSIPCPLCRGARMTMHPRIPWVMSRCSMCRGWGTVALLARPCDVLDIPDPLPCPPDDEPPEAA